MSEGRDQGSLGDGSDVPCPINSRTVPTEPCQSAPETAPVRAKCPSRVTPHEDGCPRERGNGVGRRVSVVRTDVVGRVPVVSDLLRHLLQRKVSRLSGPLLNAVSEQRIESPHIYDPPAICWNSRFLGGSWDKTPEDDQTAYPKETNSLQPAWSPLALPGFPPRGGAKRARKGRSPYSTIFAWL